MLYLIGERLSQEDAIVYNSRLIEQELMTRASFNEASDDSFNKIFMAINHADFEMDVNLVEQLMTVIQALVKQLKKEEPVFEPRVHSSEHPDRYLEVIRKKTTYQSSLGFFPNKMKPRSQNVTEDMRQKCY